MENQRNIWLIGEKRTRSYGSKETSVAEVGIMHLPEDVKFIIETLNSHGYEAYAVGGCVRDSILNRIPEDWDITTSAMPEETKTLFKRTFDTGIEHGTITVLLNGVGYEVTTYRIDGTYEDSRHPTEVSFTRNLQEDLLRRDFTINAMAYNEQDGLVDIFGGMKDLQDGIIRCVGDAHARFGEDALRILRAIRFAAQLGFHIEEETKQGIRELAYTLRNISAERIQVEMVKLLMSQHPEHIQLAYELDVTAVIFPEWDERKDKAHALQTLQVIPCHKAVRLAVVLHRGQGDDIPRQVLRRWKFDNETLKATCKLVKYYDYEIDPTAVQVRRAMNEIGVALFPYYLEIRNADILAREASGKMKDIELTNIAVLKENNQKICELYKEIIEKEQCITLKQLAVKGTDLLSCGVNQGKEIGSVLQELLDIVLEKPQCNTKEYLIAQVPQVMEGLSKDID